MRPDHGQQVVVFEELVDGIESSEIITNPIPLRLPKEVGAPPDFIDLVIVFADAVIILHRVGPQNIAKRPLTPLINLKNYQKTPCRGGSLNLSIFFTSSSYD